MLRFKTNMTDIVNLAIPNTYDDYFFILLSSKGEVRVFNYTIIDS
jgi:hypothetical protein